MGGLVVAAAISDSDHVVNSDASLRSCISGIILSSPALAVHIQGRLNKLLAPWAAVVNRIPGARKITKPNDIPVAALTSDTAVQAAYEADPLVHNLVSFGVAEDFLALGTKLSETVRADALGARALAAVRVPVLLTYGDNDAVVDRCGGEEFAAAARAGGDSEDAARVVVFPNCLHEPFNETGAVREGFYREIAAFISERLK